MCVYDTQYVHNYMYVCVLSWFLHSLHAYIIIRIAFGFLQIFLKSYVVNGLSCFSQFTP
jgi:hypothetical protein